MEQKRKQTKAQTGWGIDISSREEIFKWADETEVQEESQGRKCPITSGAAAAIIRKRSREMAKDYTKPIYVETKFQIKNSDFKKISKNDENGRTVDETIGGSEKGKKQSGRDHRDRSLKYTGKSYKIMITFLGAGGDRKQETKGIG